MTGIGGELASNLDWPDLIITAMTCHFAPLTPTAAALAMHPIEAPVPTSIRPIDPTTATATKARSPGSESRRANSRVMTWEPFTEQIA